MRAPLLLRKVAARAACPGSCRSGVRPSLRACPRLAVCATPRYQDGSTDFNLLRLNAQVNDTAHVTATVTSASLPGLSAISIAYPAPPATVYVTRCLTNAPDVQARYVFDNASSCAPFHERHRLHLLTPLSTLCLLCSLTLFRSCPSCVLNALQQQLKRRVSAVVAFARLRHAEAPKQAPTRARAAREACRCSTRSR